MKSKILKMLRNSDDFISGQSICDTLNISRTAVWKYINQLKMEGYEFEAVSNKGYRIVNCPDIITKEEIESQLVFKELESVVKKVVFYDEIDSTNNSAKQAAEEGEEAGTLFVTEHQSAGRGRRGKTWIASVGSEICMTLLLRPKINPTVAPMLTIITAMAVANALNDITKKECLIKWPNDIVMGNHKVCGILTEMSAEPDWTNYVVIGIGINVNTKQFDDEVKDIATSIYLQTGEEVKRSNVIVQFIEHFSKMYAKFIETCNLSRFIDDYNKLLINRDRQVKINENDNSYVALAQGIDEQGRLIVVKEDGQKVKIMAGEVSVRGLYGYV